MNDRLQKFGGNKCGNNGRFTSIIKELSGNKMASECNEICQTIDSIP